MRKPFCALVSVIWLLRPQTTTAQGTTYISNLDQAAGGSMVVGSDSWLAESFFTGTNLPGYSLSSVQLKTVPASGAASGFSVAIYSNDPNNFRYPGNRLGELTGPDPAAGGIYAYTAANITLSPSTYYFVVVTAATSIANGAYSWSYAGVSSYTASGGWQLGPYHHSSADGSVWNRTAVPNMHFAVDASPVPEPAVAALMGIGLACLLLGRHKRNRVGEMRPF